MRLIKPNVPTGTAAVLNRLNSVLWLKLLLFTGGILLLCNCSNQSATTGKKATAAAQASASRQQRLSQRQGRPTEQAVIVGDVKNTEALLQQLIQDKPRNYEHWVNLATLQYQNQRYTEAERVAGQGRALHPENQQLLNISGLIAVELGKFKDAENFYQQAIAKDPDYPLSHYNLALLYDIFYQDTATAIRHYKRYLVLSDFKDKATVDWVKQLENSAAGGG